MQFDFKFTTLPPLLNLTLFCGGGWSEYSDIDMVDIRDVLESGIQRYRKFHTFPLLSGLKLLIFIRSMT